MPAATPAERRIAARVKATAATILDKAKRHVSKNGTVLKKTGGGKKKKPMSLAVVLETLGVPPAQQWVPGENGPGPTAPANTDSIAK